MTPRDVTRVVNDLRDLPALPSVVVDLISAFGRDDIDVTTLADKMSMDQGMAAKILRIANSSFYGLPSKVKTVRQAVLVLGFDNARALAVASKVIVLFGGAHQDRVAEFWRHSIATALCARSLARHAGLDQDAAFIGGLLHDIGRLVLVAGHPDAYAQVVAWRTAHGGDWQEAEQAVLGIDHVDAGVALADHWNFSNTMRQAIAYHHAPDIHGAGFLAAIVHVANAIVHALDLAGEDDELVPRVSSVAWDAMGLNEEAYLHLFRETELQFGEMSAILMA
jgi:putative nucleotidyltransferase with HDIG domain